MLVLIDAVTKFFGAKEVLQKVNLSIEPGERIGLIGKNGCGKSTLLRIITGKELPDEGSVSIMSGATIGFLEQNSGLDRDRSIIDEMRSVFESVLECEARMRKLEIQMAQLSDHDGTEYRALEQEYNQCGDFFAAHDGYQIDVKIKTVLNGMGFGDRNHNDVIRHLSGGEKTRLAMAKLLLEEPDLLILDEPTNHLDFRTLGWLEEYLLTYKGAILVVSHDRYFLDRLVGKICEIEQHRLLSFKGNYTKYLTLKEELIERQMKEYEAQQNEIASLQDYADRNIVRASTSQSAKSRLKAIDRMELIDRPYVDEQQANLKFEFDRTPHKDLVVAENLGITVGTPPNQKQLFSDLNLTVRRNEKVAIIGENGIGKSSFLKAIQNLISYDGRVTWSPNVDVSYYEQENSNLNPENTVLEELWSRFPKWPEFKVRAMLGRVLLTQDNVYKKVSVISGGERAKLVFAILMAERPNVLILDEPTNHLDLVTKEVLEHALMEYEGSIIMVSHDRYLLNRVPTQIIEMKRNGISCYPGRFDDYQEKKKVEEQRLIVLENSSNAPKDSEDKKNNSYYRSKQQRSEEAKRKRRLSELESIIEQREAVISRLEEDIANPEISADYERLTACCNELEGQKEQLQEALDEWILLSDE